MRIICAGGGPAGLYFALLMKKHNPAHHILVFERHPEEDSFGWGVVFSDQAFSNFLQADEASAHDILESFHRWDEIDIHIRDELIRSKGHGFCGVSRRQLLAILTKRCRDLEIEIRYGIAINDIEELASKFKADLVIAADGLNSPIRTRYEACFQPDIVLGKCRYVWLGTTQLFDSFTFAFEETPWGWFQAHAYRYDDQHSSFIVETHEQVWRDAGLEDANPDLVIDFLQQLFAKILDGHPLIHQHKHQRGSTQWARFPRVVCKNWVHNLTLNHQIVPIVLIGDAAHTAHFSVGSGTRLAMEDAIELSRCLARDEERPLQEILQHYQQVRTSEVLRIQNAARNSMTWFESVDRYAKFEAPQFAYSLLTRSQRISHENLRLRDPDYIQHFEKWLSQEAAVQSHQLFQVQKRMPPMFTPFRVRALTLKNRIVVSPMAQYSAHDGVVGDFHVVHLGARALGGAALVMAEMTAVSAQGRITQHCPGLYADRQVDAWKRVVDFVHHNSDARIGIQLGHAGAKGATKVPWEGSEQPLSVDAWPLVSASPQQYIQGVSQWASEASLLELAKIKDDFVKATINAMHAGFDWLELHCAHGYLLSSFISPLTNQRADRYGGDLLARCAYPLEVFHAIRQVWPDEKPISIRISAHDWMEGGIVPDDAVEIARLFKAAGADLIDCSSGLVVKEEKPIFGRMYQTPFSDQIRNEVGIPTIAVGAIFESDHVNSIIAAGRADLCAIGRAHLADPAWTLHQAAQLGVQEIMWPRQYYAGKQQVERIREHKNQTQD